MVKRALLIGCNYKGSSCPLDGCWQDVANMKDLLLGEGYLEDNIDTKTDEKEDLNADSLVDIMKAWIAKAGPEDVLFFHFSGHGGQLPDMSKDELDRRDECIYGSDLNEIVDDDLYKILIAPLGPRNKLTLVGDCCHSGSGFDLPFRLLTVVALQENRNAPRARVFGFSGCRDEQTSADAFIDGKSQGALTAMFIKAYAILKSDKRKKMTYAVFLAEIQKQLRSGKFSQIPQLSYSHPGGGLDRVIF